MKRRILIADDDRAQRRYLASIVTASGDEVEEVGGGEAVVARVTAPDGVRIDAILLDVNMPDLNGIEVLRRIRPAKPDLPVLVLTSDGSIARAVEAMQSGANDFLVKPVAPERLSVSLDNACTLTALSTEVRRLSRQEENRLSFSELVCASPATRSAIKMARRAAGSSIPVLIEGESGVGKEVFARAIHGESERSGGPFVAVNCGALPANLVESILFGHEKGAFTGAVQRREGKFKEADGGTLFLDEIGDLPLEAQVKLLRAIQTGEIDPVGGSKPARVDIRLVSATNRDLGAMVRAGRFREDLYYRLSVFPLEIPPLRDRRDDIPELAEMFLNRFRASENAQVTGFSQDALEAISGAEWPGNVRELENTIHRAVVLAEGSMIRPRDLQGLVSAGASNQPTRGLALGMAEAGPEPLRRSETIAPVRHNGDGTSNGNGHGAHHANGGANGRCGNGAGHGGDHPGTEPDDPFMSDDGHIRRLLEIEAKAIQRALKLYRGRMSETARRLGIGRSTLYRKIDELRIDPARD